jgi:hypothetical protein
MIPILPLFESRLITKNNLSTSLMMKLLNQYGKSEKEYKVGMIIKVDNIMQSGYSYQLSAPIGKQFDPKFKPELTPRQMLERGVFEGKYFNDQVLEFPKEWYLTALKKGKLSPQGPNPKLNYMGVKSRQSLGAWKKGNSWIYGDDPRGWGEWYFRYYLGRRDPSVDQKQISRWNGIKRFIGSLRKECKQGDMTCGLVKRQLLTNWAYDATKY